MHSADHAAVTGRVRPGSHVDAEASIARVRTPAGGWAFIVLTTESEDPVVAWGPAELLMVLARFGNPGGSGAVPA
jgi:hypothetical protein